MVHGHCAFTLVGQEKDVAEQFLFGAVAKVIRILGDSLVRSLVSDQARSSHAFHEIGEKALY